MIKVPTFIVRRARRMDGKSRDYRNSGVRSACKSIVSLYTSPVVLEDSKIAFSPGIFFIIALLIVTTIVFRAMRIDLSTNTVYSIGTFAKRLLGYISEYNLSRLSKWQMEDGKSRFP